MDRLLPRVPYSDFVGLGFHSLLHGRGKMPHHLYRVGVPSRTVKAKRCAKEKDGHSMNTNNSSNNRTDSRTCDCNALGIKEL